LKKTLNEIENLGPKEVEQRFEALKAEKAKGEKTFPRVFYR